MTDLPIAKTRPASNWSAIWVLPIIALLIGGWLGWQAYQKAGIEVQILFASGEGIEAGKTQFIYKGMPIGKVLALGFPLDGKDRGVIATLEVDKNVEPFLRSETRFWLVKPSVTLAGITGLDTLVSGNYITASPGLGKPTREFVALAEAPPLAESTPGLHITLKAERLGSLNRDSPVFYKQIQVGRVRSYALGDDQSTVDIKVFIEPQYANLVRKHTRFWNASGVTVDASLSGLTVRTESLASIVAGGIAFATPENRADSPPTDPALPFKLYSNFDDAQAGIKVLVDLPDFEGLTAGSTPVMYKGIQAGVLKKIKVNENLIGASAELLLDPRTEDYLVEGTDFWIVKPSISLGGISGIEALVKGNHIAIRPGEKGAPAKRSFQALAKAPPMDINVPGRHLVLRSSKLASLSVGSPILFRQVKVGAVQSYQLSSDHKQVLLGVHIEPEYAGLVNSSTRFWNASGVTLTGGLSGIEVKSESLQSLLVGGIAFETPDPKAVLKGRLPEFNLYSDRDKALETGVEVQIQVDTGDGLNVGTPIRYKGLEVGKVDRLELTADLKAVMLYARILKASEHIARAGSKFWVVRPEVSLVRAANLDTLVTGLYLDVQPTVSAGSAVQTRFVAQMQAPTESPSQKGLKLVLSTAARGSIKPGVAISYREVPVGKVVDYELSATADRVLLHVLIEPRYAPLVRSATKFWNTSGVTVDAGLFKGVKLRTDSLESMLEGGISFATPDNPQMGGPARAGQTFVLNSEPKDEWLQWAPKIALGK
jgi:paraquat-inducible protein B